MKLEIDKWFDHTPYIARPVEPEFAHSDVGKWDVRDHQKRGEQDQRFVDGWFRQSAAQKGKACKKDQLPAKRIKAPRTIRPRFGWEADVKLA